MKISTAFASLIAAAASVSASSHDALPLTLVLILVVALIFIGHGAFVVLYVCRKADRKDLRKLLRAWHSR